MRRVLAFAGGILSGAAIGTTVALLFTPISGRAARRGLRERYQNALEAGEMAAQQKRLELEAQLATIVSEPPPSVRN